MTAAPPAKRTGSRPRRRVYRGVQLQRISGRTRFSLAQLKKAVEAAIAKHADALAGSK